MIISLLLALSCSGPAPAAVTGATAIQVHWRGKAYAPEELPEELGQGPVAAASAWIDWVGRHDYRMDLDREARVLLISSRKNGKVARQLRLIRDTVELFDELLPAPPREEEAAAVPEERKDGAASGELPEDPDDPPAGWKPKDQPEEHWEFEWGAGTWPVDTETCVLFVARTEADYRSLLDELAEQQDYLKAWLPLGKQYTGFVLERPLAGAYIENAEGMEEWDPENEVVNRVAQLLFVRRFAQQPYWLVQGFAWRVEETLRKGIYCFPYRQGFIFAVEHTGWGNDLRNSFLDRRDAPPRLEEFASWKRGAYDDKIAKLSYGLVGHLLRHHGDQVSPFIEAMRLFRLEDNKIDLGNGSWERSTHYDLSVQDQGRFLEEYFGEDVLVEAGEYFRKGKRYRPPKPKKE